MTPSRREWLRDCTGLGCLAWARSTVSAQDKPIAPRRLFCLQANSFGIRTRQERGFDDPLTFVRFANELGFAGLQLRIGERTPQYLAQVRALKEKLGMSLEGVVPAPLEEKDAERFESELRACQAAGIDIVRTVLLSGRRYETFRSADEFRAFKTRSEQTLDRIARLAARHKVHVAVENHKDFRVREFVEMLRKIDSGFVGVCLDTGNNIALLDDPWHVVDALAPRTFSVHLKDMALESSSDGFLLAEVPLGSGFLDLHRLVRRVHEAKPQARFHLEMMTRDPLSIPCLTDDYWRTLSDTPGVDLARTLQQVRRHGRPANELPRIGALDVKEQIRREHENVTESLRWARQRLFQA